MIVISKIDKLNQLTKGKSYQVISKFNFPEYFGKVTGDKKNIFFILNDSGTKARYSGEFFLSLQEHRELNIDNLLQDDKQF